MQATSKTPNPKRIDIWQEQCSYWDTFSSCCLLPFNIFLNEVEAQNESSKKLTNADYKGLGLAVGSKLTFHQESAIVKHENSFYDYNFLDDKKKSGSRLLQRRSIRLEVLQAYTPEV